MGLFKRKADPISDRTRALNAEISALESKIKKLNQQAEAARGPRLRSTAYPSGTTVASTAAPPPPAETEPVFEEVHKLTDPSESNGSDAHYNEQGVRKFDLIAVWQRVKKQFSGRPVSNPKLVNYLAAGSIQGLRPLRYEKRVARNRFFYLAISVCLLVLGIFFWMHAQRR